MNCTLLLSYYPWMKVLLLQRGVTFLRICLYHRQIYKCINYKGLTCLMPFVVLARYLPRCVYSILSALQNLHQQPNQNPTKEATKYTRHKYLGEKHPCTVYRHAVDVVCSFFLLQAKCDVNNPEGVRVVSLSAFNLFLSCDNIRVDVNQRMILTSLNWLHSLFIHSSTIYTVWFLRKWRRAHGDDRK